MLKYTKEITNSAKNNYFSKRVCPTCSGRVRYLSNKGCVDCVRARSKLQKRPEVPSLRHAADEDYPHSRAEALLLGLRKYYSDKPCGRGHTGLRDTRTYRCLFCASAFRKRKYYKKPSRKGSVS